MTRTAALTLALVLLPLSSCGGDDGNTDTELTVLAASSLTEVFTELGESFEENHDGLEVRLSFGSSTTLADQAAQGAPGDVLATADETSMAIADDAGVLADDPLIFAANEMVLVVPADNPGDVSSFDDLVDTDWVRCADDVPCGRVATALVAANGVTAEPASLEVDVKSVLAKVTSGEADAGLVYRTDAQAAGDDVQVIEIPHAADHRATYVIAALSDADDDDLAAEFRELVLSADGQQALTDAGFTTFRAG
jgi:molybdate transport system substrate-binding protein